MRKTRLRSFDFLSKLLLIKCQMITNINQRFIAQNEMRRPSDFTHQTSLYQNIIMHDPTIYNPIQACIKKKTFNLKQSFRVWTIKIKIKQSFRVAFQARVHDHKKESCEWHK